MGFVSMRRNFGRHMRTLLYIIFGIFLVSCFYFYGAYTGPSARREEPGGSGGAVIAMVDGQRIELAPFELRFQEQYERYAQMGMASLDMLEMLRWRLLEGLIEQKLLVAAAKRQGIEASRGDVNKELDRQVAEALKGLRGGRGESREYRDRVERSIRSRADEVREMLMVQRLQEMVKSQIKASDQDMRDAYKRVRARHILIRVDPTGKAGLPEDKAKKKAEEILAKLKGGADFASLAKQFSDDKASAAQGGDLGYFGGALTGLPRMTPEFEKATFALKPGQISDIVKTPYGYHIIKVEDEQYDLPKDFDQKKEQYRKQYVEQQAGQAWPEFVQQLRQQAKVDIRNPELRGAQEQWQGKTDAAIADFTKALDSAGRAGDQVHAAIYYTLGGLYGQKGDWKKSVAMYEHSLDVASESLQEIYVALGDAYRKLDNKEKALEYYKAAEDEAPDDSKVRQRLLTAYQAMGNVEAAARQKDWIAQEERKRAEEEKKRVEEMARRSAQEAQKKAGASEPTAGRTSEPQKAPTSKTQGR